MDWVRLSSALPKAPSRQVRVAMGGARFGAVTSRFLFSCRSRPRSFALTAIATIFGWQSAAKFST
jgi:hypothetical protein